jgi:hypothetical protein
MKLSLTAKIVVGLFVLAVASALTAKVLTFVALTYYPTVFFEQTASVAVNIAEYGLVVALFANVPLILGLAGIPALCYAGVSKFAHNVSKFAAFPVIGILGFFTVYFGLDAMFNVITFTSGVI